MTETQTTQAGVREQALTLLAELGGRLSQEDDIVFAGRKFVLPETCADLTDAIDFLDQRRRDEETETRFSRTFPYRPYDGAIATARAIKEAFGFSVSKPIRTFFGTEPPELIDVQTGVDQVEQAPWGALTIPGLKNTTVYLSGTRDEELGTIFQIIVDGPRKYRHHAEGLFLLVQRNLEQSSIYRGHAIDGRETPNFIDVSTVDPTNVVYTEEVTQQLEANVWSPIKHAEVLAELGQPGKRSVLFEGPYGSGKTLAALLTAQVAEQHGWTFILCRPGRDDLQRTLQTARMYQPSLVFFEDLDVVAGGGDVDQVTTVLDMFDGMQTKGLKMGLVLTTNHVENIHKGMLRAGRLDAIVHIGAMDRPGVERLAKRVIGDKLDATTDFDEVFAALDGFMPAFVKEAFDRAVRYNVSRNDGELTQLGTADLVQAAHGLRPQLELMENASDKHTPPRFDGIVRGIMQDVVRESVVNLQGSQYPLGIAGE